MIQCLVSHIYKLSNAIKTFSNQLIITIMTQNNNSSELGSNISSIDDILQKCGKPEELKLSQMKKIISVISSNLKQLMSHQNRTQQKQINNSPQYFTQYVDVFVQKISFVDDKLSNLVTNVQLQMHHITDDINKQISQIKIELQKQHNNYQIKVQEQVQKIARRSSPDSQRTEQREYRPSNIQKQLKTIEETKDSLTQKIRSTIEQFDQQRRLYFEQIVHEKTKQVQRQAYQRIDIIWKDILQLYKKQKILTEKLVKITNVVSLFTVITDQNFQYNRIQPTLESQYSYVQYK